jgi:hypothetical protein
LSWFTRAPIRALLGRETAQRLHQAGDAALLAERRHARDLEGGQVGRLLHGAERLAAYRRKIVHPSLSQTEDRSPNRTRKREPAVQAPSFGFLGRAASCGTTKFT